VIDTLLLTATKIFSFDGNRPLTNASGFFFARGGRLYLVTSRHVMIDEPSKHFPDRIQVELHVDPDNIAARPAFRYRCTATARACGTRLATLPVTSTWP